MYVFLCYLLYFAYYINKYGFIILKHCWALSPS